MEGGIVLICCFWQILLRVFGGYFDFAIVRTGVLLKAFLQGADLGFSTNKPAFNCL